MARNSAPVSILRRMNRKPGELFTFADFSSLPVTAVGPALSRLHSNGKIQKARKGVYYVPRETVLGAVPVDPVSLTRKIAPGKSFLSGLAAANALGLTTQVPARPTLAIEGNRPTGISNVEFETRSGTNRKKLDPMEVALLEVLRTVRRSSDLDRQKTVELLTDVVKSLDDPDRLVSAALSEPPRVRAMVGALVEASGVENRNLERLRKSLNPVSRFEFGPLTELASAAKWNAKAHAASSR